MTNINLECHRRCFIIGVLGEDFPQRIAIFHSSLCKPKRGVGGVTAKIYLESGEMGIFAQVRCFAGNQLGLILEKLSWIYSVREFFAWITGFQLFTDLAAIKKMSVVIVAFRVFTVLRFRLLLGAMIACLF